MKALEDAGKKDAGGRCRISKGDNDCASDLVCCFDDTKPDLDFGRCKYANGYTWSKLASEKLSMEDASTRCCSGLVSAALMYQECGEGKKTDCPSTLQCKEGKANPNIPVSKLVEEWV